MIPLQLLEAHDNIQPTDWCRPLELFVSADDTVDRYSPYSGRPMNFVRWVLVKDVIGEMHWGKTVEAFNKGPGNTYWGAPPQYEFMRGDLSSHALTKG